MDTKPLDELIIDPNNPKAVSEFMGNTLVASLKKYGSLDGIVFNRKLGKLVGGNTRMQLLYTKLIGNNRVVYTTKYDVPDEQGTVALGNVWHNNLPIPYREVEFDEVIHREANLAATLIHGDTVDQLLAETNQFIMENNGDVFSTGQTDDDINRLLEEFGGGAELESTEETQAQEKKPKHDDGMKRLQAKFTDEQMLIIDEAIMLMKRDRQLTQEVNPDLSANALYYICLAYKEQAMSQNASETPQTTDQTIQPPVAEAPAYQTPSDQALYSQPSYTPATSYETPASTDLTSIPE